MSWPRIVCQLGVLALSAFVANCSDAQLTRDTAFRMIQDSGAAPEIVKVQIRGGLKYNKHCKFCRKDEVPRFRRTEKLKQEFLERLSAQGFVEGGRVVTPPDEHGGFVYEARPSENVLSVKNGIDVTIAVPVLEEVTGISQEGARARVVVRYGFRTTGMLEKLNGITAEVISLDPEVAGPAGKWLWESFPASLPPAQSRTFSFRRWDDGWRIE